MESITTNVGNVLDLSGTVLTHILENPVLAFFFCCGIVGTIIGVVSQLKHA